MVEYKKFSIEFDGEVYRAVSEDYRVELLATELEDIYVQVDMILSA